MSKVSIGTAANCDILVFGFWCFEADAYGVTGNTQAVNRGWTAFDSTRAALDSVCKSTTRQVNCASPVRD